MIPGLELVSDAPELEAAVHRALVAWSQRHPAVTVSLETGSARRSKKENAVIAASQRLAHRNPWYIDKITLEQIAKLLITALQLPNWRDSFLREMGETLRDGVRRHVRDQLNPDKSRFKPLSPAYAAKKAREFGHALPILRATGELIDTLRVEVRKAA